MAREPGDPLYEYEQSLLREQERQRAEAEAARAQRARMLDPRNMSGLDKIRYDKAAKMFAEAMASGDPTATEENKTAWIMTRMQGMR